MLVWIPCKYIWVSLINFTDLIFSHIPDCEALAIGRKNEDELKNVLNKLDSQCTCCDDRHVIWSDYSQLRHQTFCGKFEIL